MSEMIPLPRSGILPLFGPNEGSPAFPSVCARSLRLWNQAGRHGCRARR